jgi:glutathione S-transferase
MILFNGPNTPFGRMAFATALELRIGLENRIIDVYSSGFLDEMNPLRQIPTLIADEDRAIFDSRVICLFLGSLRPDNPLIARDDWDVQTRWSLAVGLMEASVARTMALRRPEPVRDGAAIESHDRRVARAVAGLEAAADLCAGEARIDRLAAAVALEYIDFRSVCDWRPRAPKLARWLEAETARPCLAASRPREAQPVAQSLR